MLRRARKTVRRAARRTVGRNHRCLAAVLALTALAVTGCGGSAAQGADVTAKELRGGSLAEDFDLSGARFTVGSKEFTEQKILGSITQYALRAAGARTKDQTGLSGSTIVRGALEGREIDMYWEYSGTGWTQYLGHDRPVEGAREQFRRTATEDREKNGVVWLGPTRFGNQYAIARASDVTGDLADVDELSDLRRYGAAHPEEMTLCGAAEFLDRELRAIQKTYDVGFPAPQVYQNALALNYVNVAKGSPCTFAEVFTTDARIESLDLTVVKDDRYHFTTELAALTVREETLKKHPELEQLAQRLGEKLTEDTMIELNGMVDLEGRSPDEAALHFLRKHGFVGGR
ncbi:glycine betaine ABC transporter substrate-binding protein [Streptomyces sp. DSM 42041]|uniref:Glycine betaine ABC transporter substrate-binding protein n=1 Tax=Streptomyces hazeniae TaxID=3075538 RepID=A0ABU2NU11_9ACTN|nr:glycine betaine ABC transporter substrate-binding protein [Streptomyces sp. DSM 42041]MDT0379987.1 glycine betaine ABC transporter substrate-binding protein [Streptomyces sp. DSM 42041]